MIELSLVFSTNREIKPWPVSQVTVFNAFNVFLCFLCLMIYSLAFLNLNQTFFFLFGGFTDRRRVLCGEGKKFIAYRTGKSIFGDDGIFFFFL